MTQSASSPYPIRPIEEDELDGFLNVDEHAFNTSPWSDGDRRVGLGERARMHGDAGNLPVAAGVLDALPRPRL